jgi:hypothetical protein
VGTITADKILARASTLLLDLAKRHWPENELLQWANDGQLEIVHLRPDTYVVNRTQILVSGTRQTLEDDELVLIDIARNLGTAGNTPGYAVTFVDRKQLDKSNPNWHAAPSSTVVRHWAYDRANPKVWWCYPPQPAAGPFSRIEKDVSIVPPPLTIEGVEGATATSALSIDDAWINALLEFMVSRGLFKDSEHGDTGKANAAYTRFLQSLGLATETAKNFRASRNQPPRYQDPPKTGNQGAFGSGD